MFARPQPNNLELLLFSIILTTFAQSFPSLFVKLLLSLAFRVLSCLLFRLNFFGFVVDAFDGYLEMVDLNNFLRPLGDSLLWVVPDDCFLPFSTDVADRGVRPIVALLDVFTAQDPRKDYLVHIPGHWILYQQVISHLVDAHKKQSHFSS